MTQFKLTKCINNNTRIEPNTLEVTAFILPTNNEHWIIFAQKKAFYTHRRKMRPISKSVIKLRTCVHTLSTFLVTFGMN